MAKIKSVLIAVFAIVVLIAFQNCGKMIVHIDDPSEILSSSTSTADTLFTVAGPTQVAVGECAAYSFYRTNPDGSAAPSGNYAVQTVTIPNELIGLFYSNSTCTTLLPSGFNTNELPMMVYLKANVGFSGDVYLNISNDPTDPVAVTVQ